MSGDYSTPAEIFDKLAKRCGRKGRSLVLEGEIWCAVHNYKFVRWDGAGVVFENGIISGISHESARHIPAYTSNLEAGVWLVPEGVNWLVSFTSRQGYYAAVGIHGLHAESASVALCAAALNFLAKSAKGETR